jgi:hypothetical protein
MIPSEAWYPKVNAQGDPVSAVYQSRVPCLDEKALATPGCEKVKLALVLYRNRQTEAPNDLSFGTRLCRR